MDVNKILRIAGCIVLIVILFIGQFAFINHIDNKELSARLCSQELMLTVGDKYPLDNLLEGSQYSADDLMWEINDSGVVFNTTELVCVTSGEYELFARKGNKTVAKCDLDIVARSVIKLESDNKIMGEGLNEQISAQISGNIDSTLEYSSENENIVTVSDSGEISAVGSGETRIKVSAYGCDSVFVNISVSKAPAEITLSTQKLSLGVGEEHTVTATLPQDSYNKILPIFSSSDESVATVDEIGNITAVGIGKCEVTASAYSGATASCAVEVAKAPSSVKISVSDDSLYGGETVKTMVEINSGATCGGYIYSSSDPSVAEVSADGVITGKGRGKAVISVSTYNGKKDSCEVSVQIFDYMTSPTSQDIYDATKYLADFYPELISTEVIGSSVKGKDIVLLKMGKGDKKACIVAGLHAKEDIAVVFTMRCIEEYAAAYHSSSGKFGSYNMKKMLDEYTLYIVPLMNPDGLDIVNAGEMPLYTDVLPDEVREKYKSNANGVNLNRNFPFRWDQIISSPAEPDEADFRGKNENSEPETQAIVNLVEQNDFEWLFSMHCKGYFVYWADCYNEITNFDRKLSNRLESVCGFELCGATPLKNLGGGLENWFRDKTGNPGFCVELVGPNYNSEVNKYFALKTNWTKTKYTFAQGMR